MSWLRFVRGLGDAHAAARWDVMERAERDRCALVEREEQEEVLGPCQCVCSTCTGGDHCDTASCATIGEDGLWSPPGGNLQTLVFSVGPREDSTLGTWAFTASELDLLDLKPGDRLGRGIVGPPINSSHSVFRPKSSAAAPPAADVAPSAGAPNPPGASQPAEGGQPKFGMTCRACEGDIYTCGCWDDDPEGEL